METAKNVSLKVIEFVASLLAQVAGKKLVSKVDLASELISVPNPVPSVDADVVKAQTVEKIRIKFDAIEQDFRSNYSSYSNVSSALLAVRTKVFAALDEV